MSAKIYNSFVYPKRVTSVGQLFKLIDEVIGRVRAVSFSEVRKNLGFSLAHHYDRWLWHCHTTEKPDKEMQPVAKIRKMLAECRVDIKEGARNPLFDFTGSVTFFHYLGKVYCMVHCEHTSKLRDGMLRYGWQEYEYWDNTDKPEGLTRAQWEQRRDTWDKILPDGFPSMSGVTRDIWPDWYTAPVYDFRLALDLQPTQDERITGLVFCILADRYMKRHKDDADADEGFDLYLRARVWVGSKSGKRAGKKLRAQLAGLLPDRVRITDLYPDD